MHLSSAGFVPPRRPEQSETHPGWARPRQPSPSIKSRQSLPSGRSVPRGPLFFFAFALAVSQTARPSANVVHAQMAIARPSMGVLTFPSAALRGLREPPTKSRTGSAATLRQCFAHFPYGRAMHVHTRSAYRWDGKKIDPDVVRQNEEQLDRLLRMARARNAAAQSVERSSLEEWPARATTSSGVRIWPEAQRLAATAG